MRETPTERTASVGRSRQPVSQCTVLSQCLLIHVKLPDCHILVSTRSAQAQERYRRVRAAVEELEAESTRSLHTLRSRQHRQQDIAGRMLDSIQRNTSILFDCTHQNEGYMNHQDLTVSTSPAFRAGKEESEQGFESWLHSFKATRPSAAPLGGMPQPASQTQAQAPTTPPAPPCFDDSPDRTPRGAPVALPPSTPDRVPPVLSESPTRSTPPVRHIQLRAADPMSSPTVPLEERFHNPIVWSSEASFSVLDGQEHGGVSQEQRPPPHPHSRLGVAAGMPHLTRRDQHRSTSAGSSSSSSRAPLSRHRFINM